VKNAAKPVLWGLFFVGLGGLSFLLSSRLFSPPPPSQDTLFANLNKSTAKAAAPGGGSASLASNDASDDDELVSLLSSAMHPNFVEFLYTPRIQVGLEVSDVDMIETRLLAELPAAGSVKFEDPREAEVAARYAIVRALHKAHVNHGIAESLVPRLTTIYKKLLQSPQYSVFFKAQSLRNLAVVGIAADELERDRFLEGVDPRIHRIAAMDDIEALGSEE
jgi:hypothetical protein